MFDRNQWEEIFESLWRNKIRTALTGLSVFWGMLILVVLLGCSLGLQRGVEYQFKDDAINSLWIYTGTTSEPYQGLPSGRRVILRNRDYDVLENMPAVEHVTGRYYLSGEFFVSRGQESNAFPIRCVHPGHQYLENTEMLTGRYINDYDNEKLRKVCVIGIEVVESLYEEDEVVIGTYILVKGTPYQVVGTFKDSGGRNENRQIYIPVRTAQRVDNGQDRLSQIMLTVGDISVKESQRVEEQIRRDIAARHKINPFDEQALYISNNLEEFQQFQGLFFGIKTFVWIVGILTLIAGIIGISNIMLISVNERTKEIGVRKALGATDFSLVGQIIQEAILITAMAGFFGMMLGIGLLWAVESSMPPPDSSTMFMNPGVTPGVVLGALSILVVSGALSGLIPATKAVRIAPAVAMKY
jgi:putative ABC transport system permease protein